MADNIARINGQDSFAYTGKAGWHRKGQELSEDATLEQWAEASGLNYEILRAVVNYQTLTHGTRESACDHVLYRSDTGERVGVVSDGYKIVQPLETLEFFREFCESNALSMETAGALQGGSIYWALAKTGREDNFGKSGVLDVINQYVLLSSSCDGSRATSASINSTRVVCNNTLTASDRTGKARVNTRHSTQFNAQATKSALGLVDLDASWEKFRAEMLQLQSVPFSSDEASAFFADLLRPAGTRAAPRKDLGASDFASLLAAPVGAAVEFAKTDGSPRAIRGLADLEQSYIAAPGAVPGTAYGVLQGVTHYIDHVRGNDDKRQVSAMFGQGESLKSSAFAKLLAMA